MSTNPQKNPSATPPEAEAHRQHGVQRPSQTAFQVTEVHKDYRLEKHVIRVLKGITLTVAAGEWVALVGRSGSGKTTLLHLLGALDDATQGEITCRGRSYRTMSNRQKATLRRDEIGFVFQSYHLFPELNALENVVLPALHLATNRRAARDTARDLPRDFGLGERLRHRPPELSGGEQQRVALARALINSPAIILADEPTGNLDKRASQHIIDILTMLHRRHGKTIVMVSHDLDLARLADRVLLIDDGVAVPHHGQ